MARRQIQRATDTFVEILVLYTIVVVVAGLLFAWFEGKDVSDSI